MIMFLAVLILVGLALGIGAGAVMDYILGNEP